MHSVYTLNSVKRSTSLYVKLGRPASPEARSRRSGPGPPPSEWTPVEGGQAKEEKAIESASARAFRGARPPPSPRDGGVAGGYLVDPASSHIGTTEVQEMKLASIMCSIVYVLM